MGRQVTRPIPDTTVFDLRASRRGYRLNRLCAALCRPENRAEFQRAVGPQARRVHRHYYAPMTTGMGLITFEAA